MKLLFLGTPDFAVPSLEAILDAGHHVPCVVTQPDRPKGRGQKLAASPVKETAVARGIEVWQPTKLRPPETVQHFRSFGADAWIVVGYGRIIPPVLLEIPPMGLINVHASLLPKYRGAAPVQWAVARGETTTGVTTMRIDEGLDSGDILLQRTVAIGEEETAAELWHRLARIGAELLVETLDGLSSGRVSPRKQDDAGATFAPVLKKEDGQIDWTRPAGEIFNRCRGLTPWPGCYTRFRGRQLHIWRSRVAAEDTGVPVGHLAAWKKRLVAGCGGGTSLELLEVQAEGRNRVTGQAFLNGSRIAAPEPVSDRE